MNGFAIMLTMAALGIDYGWQPTGDGQLEYIIQVEPNLLDSLRNGQDLVSKIPPEARGASRVRIHVGTGPVPRIATNGGAPATGSVSSATLGDRPNMGLGGQTAAPPLLNLPPPPWTDQEKRQLHSVLVNNRDRVADRSMPNSGTMLEGPPPPLGPLATGVGDSILPNRSGNMPASSAGPRNTGSIPGVPANGATGVYLGNPPPGAGTYGPMAPSNRGSLGPPSMPTPPRDSTNDILPNRPISAPNGGSFDLPIRDPQAATNRRNSPNSLPARSQPDPSQQATGQRRAKLMDLVRKNSSPPEPSQQGLPRAAVPVGDDAAASKPVLDQETADKLLEMQAAKPWMPLVLTSLALFASLAANAYLGWIAIGVYRRYRRIVAELRNATASSY